MAGAYNFTIATNPDDTGLPEVADEAGREVARVFELDDRCISNWRSWSA